MRRLTTYLGVLGALGALGGCAVVPYNAGYPAYPADSYGAGYVAPPVYGPVYAAPPAYVGPPVYLGFGLNYRSGGYHGRGFRGGYRGRW